MNIDQATAILKTLIIADIPTFLWGPPGIGKSDLVAQVAHQLGYGLVDYRLNTLETVDLRGLPRAADNGQDVVWLKPDLFVELEEYGDKPVILFLDEWNTSNPSMMAVSMQLTLSRRIGPHRLRKNVRIIGAGNRQGDKAAAQKMPTALANRLAHLDLQADHKAWRKWAIKHGMNPALVAYLDFKPTALHDMKGDDLRAFPTPRAWSQVHKILDSSASAKGPTIRALVGEGAMNEFMAFLRMWAKMPDIDNLIANPKKAQVPPEKEPAILYAVASALSYRADESNIAAIMSYAERLPRDFARLCVASIEQKSPELKKHPAMMAWEAGQSVVRAPEDEEFPVEQGQAKPIVFPDWSTLSAEEVVPRYAAISGIDKGRASVFIHSEKSYYLWGSKRAQGTADFEPNDHKRTEAAKFGVWPHWSFKTKAEAMVAIRKTTGLGAGECQQFVERHDWLVGG